MTDVSSSRLAEIIEGFQATRILVVGDVLLDTYLSCKALGVANEAPVPLLEIGSQTHTPGGAGNVALNLARLGVKTQLVGTAGEDAEGEILRQLLQEAGADFQVLAVQRPTSHKTRIQSGQHYYLRVDEEEMAPLNSADRKALVALIQKGLSSAEAVVISDYDKGMMSASLAETVEELAEQKDLPIFADLKPRNARDWHKLSLITPNLTEALVLLNRPTCAESFDPGEMAVSLSRQFRCDVVLKLSSEGIVAATTAGERFRVSARCQHPKNVSGAGDTVLATLGAAMTRGASLPEAAMLANLAAALAVDHDETYAVSAEELRAAARSQQGFRFEV